MEKHWQSRLTRRILEGVCNACGEAATSMNERLCDMNAAERDDYAKVEQAHRWALGMLENRREPWAIMFTQDEARALTAALTNTLEHSDALANTLGTLGGGSPEMVRAAFRGADKIKTFLRKRKPTEEAEATKEAAERSELERMEAGFFGAVKAFEILRATTMGTEFFEAEEAIRKAFEAAGLDYEEYRNEEDDEA